MKDLRGRLTPFRFGCLTNKRSRSPCRTRLIDPSGMSDDFATAVNDSGSSTTARVTPIRWSYTRSPPNHAAPTAIV